jgi:hypothetical protein
LTRRLSTSTPLRDFMKQIVRAPSRASRASISAASPRAERRVSSAASGAPTAGSGAPPRRSPVGGFHTTIRRRGVGEPSSSISRTSSRPVRRSASSTGLAIVADVIRKIGEVPYAAAMRRSRRSTLPTCEPNTPR